MKITSQPLTLLDTTDSRKLEVYISSNHPNTQLYNVNNTTNKYTPDWSTTNLKLGADIFLDSKKITPEKKKWYRQVVNNAEEDLFPNADYTEEVAVSTNMASAIVTYICKVEYQGLTALSKITFTRTDAGRDGANGTPAPAVQAQYSADGSTGWTATLNAATHKYIRYSYDGGKTWTTAIKMVGEDGTSVKVKGTATSKTAVSGTSYFTLVYNGTTITGATLGDAYLLDGNMYVCVDSRDGNDYFMDVGRIQGPQGQDGQSSYVFIRYATDANGANMVVSPTGTTTHIGICTVNTNVAPTTASSYTWSKFVGDSAKSIVLSGDSQVFKIGASNVATPATIKVTAQAFNTSVTTWTYSTNGGQTFVSTAPTGVVLNGNVVTITGASLTSNSLVIKASDGAYSDVFTVYKAFDGANGEPGAPASMAFLTNENISFSANASGQVALTSFTTNVVAYNGTTKVTPTLGTITGLPSGMTVATPVTTGNEQILTFSIAANSTLGSASSNNGTITIPVTSPVSTNLILSWSKINTGATGAAGTAGADAYTVLLTNEAHTFAGEVSNAVNGGVAETQVLAYKGATKQSVTISTVNGKAAGTVDTDTGITGLKFKCDAISGTDVKITFTCTNTFVSPSGTIPIVLTVGGVTFTKMFTYSIAFKGNTGGTGAQGAAGSPATAYWLVSSAGVVQKSSSGTVELTPSTLTFTGKSKTGTSAPIDYGCRWIIAYSTDGTNYTNAYTSTSDETSKTFTVDSTYKSVRARMYLAGGTTTLLDEQIVPVVTDGAMGTPGVDAVTFQIYSSNGYALSTNTPTVTLQTFAYVGDVEITADATYQWYVYDESGWTIIADNSNAYLTVTREDVAFSKSYMCKMTFNGVEYTSVATIDDKNDANKVFTEKPSNYTAGDIWIVGVDYAPTGVEVGTLLRSEHTNATYEDSDWVTSLKYDKAIADLQENIETYNQYFSFDSTEGLKISAKDDNGTPSQFSTSLTNERLSFNYGNEAIAYINGTKMNIKEAEIESPLTVTGKYSGSTMLQAPVINIGNFSIIVESNGSLSIVANT